MNVRIAIVSLIGAGGFKESLTGDQVAAIALIIAGVIGLRVGATA